jgi:catechol 2,3-dioxygenase-like lactoylglutathione lyase family enzyme
MAIVGTADAERSRAFYEGVLGLRLRHDDGYAMVFEAHEALIRLARVERVMPPPYSLLGWTVDDIAGTVRALTERGVRFERYEGIPQDESGMWSPGGDVRVAWFKDPDGNLLSLTGRSAADG